MTKQTANIPNEKTQEEIYLNLTRMLGRMDVGSNSYKLSTVAMQCDEKLLEEFLNEKPSEICNLKDFLQNHLYTASFWGFPDIVNVLISYGADVNYKNKNSLWTPLHAACFQENEKVVEILLKKGTSVRSKDRCGRTSVDIASVSEKIWPYFKDLKCEKTPMDDLIKKNLLKRSSDPYEGSTPSSSRSASSSLQMRMLLGGDNQSTLSATTSKISSLQLG